MQGAEYARPTIEAPPVWDAMMAGEANTEVRLETGKRPGAGWWREFRNEELDRLIAQALDRNHDVRRVALRVMEGRAVAVAAGAGLYPQVNLDGSYSHIRRSENILVAPTGGAPQGFAAPGSNFEIWSGALDLRWELDLWGRIRRGQEAAMADADALEQDRRAVTLALVGDLGQAYFRLREHDEQIRIAEANLASRTDSLELIRSRAAAGLASDLDVRRAEVQVATGAAQIPELRRLRAAALHQIEVLAGSNPGTLDLAPKPLRSVVAQPEIPVGLPAQLLERRPDILHAERALVAANARIGEARAYFFPAVAITGQGGIQSSEFTNWFQSGSHANTIGPSVTLPIFLGGANVARLQVAEARYEQMLEGYRQTILNAFREVADLLVSIRARTDQRDRQREQAKASQAALDLVQIRYREGLVTYLDVLDAQRTVLEAELALVQTERARLTDMVGLFKALGGGWDDERI
jgi:NodT family efflux transporter outer membrane factor (OMF) lipoprotein